jgi:hypothetical protein
MISHDGKSVEPSISISPDNSWNPMGYCGLWCHCRSSVPQQCQFSH